MAAEAVGSSDSREKLRIPAGRGPRIDADAPVRDSPARFRFDSVSQGLADV